MSTEPICLTLSRSHLGAPTAVADSDALEVDFVVRVLVDLLGQGGAVDAGVRLSAAHRRGVDAGVARIARKAKCNRKF